MAAKIKNQQQVQKVSRAEQHVEKLAQMIRTWYVLNYRRAEERRTGTRSYYGSKPIGKWDGGQDKAGRKFQPIWPKIARMLLARGTDPEQYIIAQFENLGMSDLPYPNMLLSAAAQEKYDEYSRQVEDQVKQSLDIQHNQFLIELEKVRTLRRLPNDEAGRAVLMNPLTSLSALYRYVLAVRVGDMELAAQFRDLALDQYFYGAHAYDTTWGALIPDDLKQEVAELRAALAVDGGE